MRTCPILLSLIFSCAAAHAQFDYTTDNGEVTITGGCTDGAMEIPAMIDDLPVTSIGRGAFLNCSKLTSVVIPRSVTSIGGLAFRDCSKLTSVTIPDSVTSIGNGPFSRCTSLTAIEVDTLNPEYSSVEGVLFTKNQETLIQHPCGRADGYLIPDSVTSIGDVAFDGCRNLTSVNIPRSVTSIGDWAFRDCTSLTAINVDTLNSVYSSLGGVLFNKSQETLIQFPCGQAESYVIPDSVTSIGQGAFVDCSKLTSVVIPRSVTSIGSGAFFRCTSLNGVTIPDNVTSIGQGAFSGCSKLTSVVIPHGVTSIPFSAFRDCSSLIRVAIGNSVTSIGNGAFSGCTSLTSVTIPDSVTILGDEAFSECSNLTRLFFKGNAPFGPFRCHFVGPFGLFGNSTAIVHYRAGATRWSQTYYGRPTALWRDPPVYGDWIGTTDLPLESAETADSDQDDMDNYTEMLAGTDPTDPGSVLRLEREARPSDLTDDDKAPIEANQHAVYVQSVPGKTYAVQWANSPTGPWNVDAVFTATTTQMRFVFDKPEGQGYYRVILAQ